MAKSNSISELTYKLKNIARDIRKAIATKGVLDEENVKDDLSLFSGYITETIISNFEQSLQTSFFYPPDIIEYIYKRFSKGGYYFYKKYQEPYLTRDDGTKMKLEEYPIPDTLEIRNIFSSSKITYEEDGEEKDFYISYFPILNLTEFEEINDLFTTNRTVIGLPNVIYDSSKVTTLVNAFAGCWLLQYVSIEAVDSKGTGELPSKVPFGTIFKDCISLQDFDVKNIIPTNITGLAINNDIKSSALEKLDLTHITAVGDIGGTLEKSDSGYGFTPNLYMPKCLKAKNMLQYGIGGCGNLTFGVGCLVNSGTFGRNNYASKVGIISGVLMSFTSTHENYNSTCVHNLLYSVATDVRTYGHPNDSNPEKVRKLTFHANAITRYNASEIKTEDETNIVCIQDTLTVENTLNFSVEDNELNSLNDAISSSTSLKKPLELYDAIYNKNNNTRYYITALNDGVVTTFHKYTFELFEDKDENGKTVQKARLAEGTIFDLMAKRCWTYG